MCDGTLKDAERRRWRARPQVRHARGHGQRTPMFGSMVCTPSLFSVTRTSGAIPRHRIPSRNPGVPAAALEAMLWSVADLHGWPPSRTSCPRHPACRPEQLGGRHRSPG